MKLSGKLIALDLDGTLTNSEKKITPRTREALLRVQEEGARLILASGRPIYGVQPLADELQMEKHGGIILSFNGARTVDCATGKLLLERTIPMELYSRIFAAMRNFPEVALMTYKGPSILTEEQYAADRYVREEAWINQIPVVAVPDLEKAVDYPVIKFLGGLEPSLLAGIEPQVVEALSDIVDIYRSSPFFLEILPKGIDKGSCLAALFDKIGLSREDLIAFGDGYNDLTMLKFAGLGIAMSNSVPEALAAADRIAGSNDEDGIADAIEALEREESL